MKPYIINTQTDHDDHGEVKAEPSFQNNIHFLHTITRTSSVFSWSKVNAAPSAGQLSQQLENKRRAHTQQLAEVNQEHERLRKLNSNAQVETDERIRSLEKKLGTKKFIRKDSDFT